MANDKAKKKNVGFGFGDLLLPVASGIVATVITAVAAVLIIGKLAYATNDPAHYAPPIGAVALYISTFVGGLISNLLNRKHFGAVVLYTAAITLVIFLIGLVAGGGFTKNILLKLLVIPCSLLGGTLCYLRVPKKKKPKFKGRSK